MSRIPGFLKRFFEALGLGGFALIVVMFVSMVFIGLLLFPLAVIASLNLLFHLSIPYTFKTFCAVVVLRMALVSSSLKSTPEEKKIDLTAKSPVVRIGR